MEEFRELERKKTPLNCPRGAEQRGRNREEAFRTGSDSTILTRYVKSKSGKFSEVNINSGGTGFGPA
jgi:hypothetical protein